MTDDTPQSEIEEPTEIDADELAEIEATVEAALEHADVFERLRLTVDLLEAQMTHAGDTPLIFGIIGISDAADGERTRGLARHFKAGGLDDADFITTLTAVESFNSQLSNLGFDVGMNGARTTPTDSLGEALSEAMADGRASVMPIPTPDDDPVDDDDAVNDAAFN